MAYYRRAKQRLEEFMSAGPPADSYPQPVSHCDFCNWRGRCDKTWREDDHLSLVAGISKLQRAELEEHGITTLETFATAPQPLPAAPSRGSLASLAKSHRQAQIQLKGRESGLSEYEFNEVEEGRGFLRLPAPSAGDIFFDIEGNPRAIREGLEYLLGFAFVETDRESRSRTRPTLVEAPLTPAPPNSGESGYDTPLAYRGLWGLTKSEEKRAFEAFIDFAMQRGAEYPDMHIYHYAPYEPSALKRLAARHATREDELDRLLRGQRLVDLYAVVRQGIRASVERCSIKDLEPFYGYECIEELDEARSALRMVERLIELGLNDTGGLEADAGGLGGHPPSPFSPAGRCDEYAQRTHEPPLPRKRLSNRFNRTIGGEGWGEGPTKKRCNESPSP
jgi:uncharacterized protein